VFCFILDCLSRGVKVLSYAEFWLKISIFLNKIGWANALKFYFWIIIYAQIRIALFSHKSQMDGHTCKLCSKCLKEDKSLEKCEVVECKNVIHPSFSKKLIASFGEGPLLCGKH